MVQNRKKPKNTHLILYFPMSKEVREVSKQASEWPTAAVWILGYSGPQWRGRIEEFLTVDRFCRDL